MQRKTNWIAGLINTGLIAYIIFNLGYVFLWALVVGAIAFLCCG